MIAVGREPTGSGHRGGLPTEVHGNGKQGDGARRIHREEREDFARRGPRNDTEVHGMGKLVLGVLGQG